VSARHQVNGWIVFRGSQLLQAGPAEETSFLRSVRISKKRSAISPGPKPGVRSGP